MTSAKILSIESSCDETAAAIIEGTGCVRADVVSSQIEIHAKWGGVVPELASRNHLLEVIPVVERARSEAGCDWSEIDAIAVTQGPGLIGALLVGLQVAKSLAYAHQKPLIAVNHLWGHLNAIYLHSSTEAPPVPPAYPHLALVVSGGHTALYKVDEPTRASLISNTRDDAAGEAFDKVSRMLGLGYPGGPVVERLAREGDPKAFSFSLPRFKNSRLDFSFSGLKTAVLTQIKKHGRLPEGQVMHDLVASFQASAVEQLTDRCMHALKTYDLNELVIAGGVACNQALRDRLSTKLQSTGRRLYAPPKKWCTDNAAMIAAAAAQRLVSAPQDPMGHQRFTGADRLSLNAKSAWAIHS